MLWCAVKDNRHNLGVNEGQGMYWRGADNTHRRYGPPDEGPRQLAEAMLRKITCPGLEKLWVRLVKRCIKGRQGGGTLQAICKDPMRDWRSCRTRALFEDHLERTVSVLNN